MDFKAIESGGSVNALKSIYSYLQDAKKAITDGTYNQADLNRPVTPNPGTLVTDPNIINKLKKEVDAGKADQQLLTFTDGVSQEDNIFHEKVEVAPDWMGLQNKLSAEIDFTSVASNIRNNLGFGTADSTYDLGLDGSFDSLSDFQNAIDKAISIVGSQLDVVA